MQLFTDPKAINRHTAQEEDAEGDTQVCIPDWALEALKQGAVLKFESEGETVWVNGSQAFSDV